MTYEEAIALRERASFSSPLRVDWARVEEACEVIAAHHVATQRAEHPDYDRAVRRGGQHRSSGARRARAKIVDENDHDRRLALLEDAPPPGWAEP